VEVEMKDVPSLIGESNGALHDYEVRYLDYRGCLQVHVVRQSKAAFPNAIASFHRAVPQHGQIRRIRKVVPE
jgi:hypothetical protein